MLRDDEFKGDGRSYSTLFREYDAVLGRWMSVDPKLSASESPYSAMGCNPILFTDVLGDKEEIQISGIEGEQRKLYYEKEGMYGETFSGTSKLDEYWHNGEWVSGDVYKKLLQNYVDNFFNENYDPSSDGFDLSGKVSADFYKMFFEKGRQKWGSDERIGNPFMKSPGLVSNEEDLIALYSSLKLFTGISKYFLFAGGRQGANVVTKSNLQLGKQMHNEYKVDLADGIFYFKEFRLPSGKRIDFLDIKNGIIYELKPNNPRAIKAGQKQLQIYLNELKSMPQFDGIDWKTVLDTY